MRADPEDAAPPIDLPLHDRDPVREERPPLRDPVHAAASSSPSSGGSRGIVIGMLVLGLLAGFGAGFIVGQRLAPPAPPRAVEVPRPEPESGIGDRGSGIGNRGSGVPGSRFEGQVAEPLPVAPVDPVPTSEAPPDPAPVATVLEAVPEPRTPNAEPRTVNSEPRTSNPRSPVPEPRPPVPVSRPATVRFDSRPPGATIYLDDVRIGITPMTMNNVAPGTHQLRMEMLGHETWRTSVTVKEGEQLFVGASLE